MRVFRGIFAVIAVLGAMLLISRVSFAQQKCEAKIKVLQDSAATLQQSHPDLAKGLSDLANEEMKESKEKMESKKEYAAKDSPERKAKHEAKVKLLQDSAAALQQVNPDLAMSLQKMAEGKQHIKTQDMRGEKNEKEEPGEKTEPASEKNEAK